jgi:oligopeptide/dipeptide ABC transporter ATP-binding protein
MTTVLEVNNLRVSFARSDAAPVVAVDGVSFRLNEGEMLALVGESGCGKSLTALSLLRLLPAAARLDPATQVLFNGSNLATLSESELRQYRGAGLAMIFQDPMSSLNPVMRVGDQIIEALKAHRKITNAAARSRAIALLREVGIADPTSRVDAWPHQLSGGMRQRVMIAIALAGEPRVLIADEPTTALDVTVQAQILELLDRLRVERQMAVLLITHDLGIVAGRADRVMVMYAGMIVETASTRDLFANPQHPYTQGLFASLPRLDTTAARLTPIAGAVPPPTRWPAGCRFHPRCPVAISRCPVELPALLPVAPGQDAACWVAQGFVA